MDVQTMVLWLLGALVLGFLGGLVSGPIASRLTVQKAVDAANDKERRQLYTTAAGLVAVTNEVATLRDMLKAGRG